MSHERCSRKRPGQNPDRLSKDLAIETQYDSKHFRSAALAHGSVKNPNPAGTANTLADVYLGKSSLQNRNGSFSSLRYIP